MFFNAAFKRVSLKGLQPHLYNKLAFVTSLGL